MAVLALILHVCGGDRDAARLLLRGLVNLVVRHERAAVGLGHHLRQRRRQRRLAVVHVTNRAHVHVRLAALEFLFGHGSFLEMLRHAFTRAALKFPSHLPTQHLTPRYRAQLEPTTGIEPVTSSLPRTCSTD